MKIDLKEFPKSKALLYKKSKESLERFAKGFEEGLLKDMSEEEKKELLDLKEFEERMANMLSDENVEAVQQAMLQENPRHLYDFFDENGVVLSVISDGNEFKYTINEFPFKEMFKSRTQIEEIAFTACFRMLENKL